MLDFDLSYPICLFRHIKKIATRHIPTGRLICVRTTGRRAFKPFPRSSLVLISSHHVPSGNCILIEEVGLSMAVSMLRFERPPSLNGFAPDHCELFSQTGRQS
jgi:hypothetical protein